MAVNPYAAPSADLNAGVGADSAALASRGSRFGAALLDGLLFLVAYIPFLAIKGDDGLPTGMGMAIGGLLFLGVAIYQIVGAVTRGQTLGKRLLGIKVVKLDNSPVDFVSIIIMRGFVGQGLLGIIPLYGLIDPLFIFREDHRCIHDLVGNTKVVEAK
jgi:uncharacterized RDD family membrane protein YckC